MYSPIPQPSMSYFNSIKICLQGYVNFKGRGRRSEFWYFYITSVAISYIFYFLATIFTRRERSQPASWITITTRVPTSSGFYVFLCIGIFFRLVTLLPFLAASTRRLHDTGKSGYFNFLYIVPFGIIVLWIFWFGDSIVGDNIYGPSTKYSLASMDPLLNNGLGGQIVQNPLFQPVQPNLALPPDNDQTQSIPVAQPNMEPEMDPQIQIQTQEQEIKINPS